MDFPFTRRIAWTYLVAMACQEVYLVLFFVVSALLIGTLEHAPPLWLLLALFVLAWFLSISFVIVRRSLYKRLPAGRRRTASGLFAGLNFRIRLLSGCGVYDALRVIRADRNM